MAFTASPMHLNGPDRFLSVNHEGVRYIQPIRANQQGPTQSTKSPSPSFKNDSALTEVHIQKSCDNVEVMGACWGTPDDDEGAEGGEGASALCVPEVVHPCVVDALVREMLALIASFVATDEESPIPLVKLHGIADKEDGWIQVVTSMVRVIPLEDTCGPSAIYVLFDECPLPSCKSVIKLIQILNLCSDRANADDINLRFERNICVVLGCIAEKLAGPSSRAVLTPGTLDYLITILQTKKDPQIVLYALVALEKYAHTLELKISIKNRIEREEENPFLPLESHIHDEDLTWRQVGFCAQWILDNTFIIEGRTLSYELQDMGNRNVILNSRDVSEYLKISSDGLEARCDSYSFESVRSTFQVDSGAWYYEVKIITTGVMQIGFATKNSSFLNHEGYGIGDDLYSLAYDGCRKLVWYSAHAIAVNEIPAWKPGDILGCYIDLDSKEVVFSLNGVEIRACRQLFNTTRRGFFAAASFMAFQQCRFNFGDEPFIYPPENRPYCVFNDHAYLSEEEKWTLPRRFIFDELYASPGREDSTCSLCCDRSPECILVPCMHK
ncbi:hypothetical protein ACJJTC_012893 [Scirpophaga incertulas]